MGKWLGNRNGMRNVQIHLGGEFFVYTNDNCHCVTFFGDMCLLWVLIDFFIGCLNWICAELIKFPTLMGSIGGWVFVVNVTRGQIRTEILSASKYFPSHISIIVGMVNSR